MTYVPRIPVDDEYLAALGRATYNFAYLEWTIVCVGEKLEPGLVAFTRKKWSTGGKIARRFKDRLSNLTCADATRERLHALVETFDALAERRNMLVHGKPMTTKRKEQRLLYQSDHVSIEWSVAAVLELAEAFETAAIEASDLLHSAF